MSRCEWCGCSFEYYGSYYEGGVGDLYCCQKCYSEAKAAERSSFLR